MMSSLFVLGGARSGKSRFALASQRAGARVTFVATAEARDPDMAARIARHRAERPPTWTTIEEALELIPRLAHLSVGTEAVVVDCLTLWIANLMLRGDGDRAVLGAVDDLVALLGRRPWPITLVSNEVGEGVHPETRDGLRFRDLLGLTNQRVAAAADRVVLMVAGLPLEIKAPPHEPSIPAVQAG
jgi:adenosylcobinamide kinase/adenosylcobinamide-phosphate guanylyltransferase